MDLSKLTPEYIEDDILKGIYALVEWGHSVVVIGGRILVIDGDYTFANSYDTTETHSLMAKDVTSFIVDHKHLLKSVTQKDQFQTYLDAELRRLYRYGMYTKYAQFIKK